MTPHSPHLTPKELRQSLRVTEPISRSVMTAQRETSKLQGVCSILKRREERALYEAQMREKLLQRQEQARALKKTSAENEARVAEEEATRLQALRDERFRRRAELKARLKVKAPAPTEKAKGWKAVKSKVNFSSFANVAARVVEDNRIPRLINEHVKESREMKLRSVSVSFGS